MAPLATVTVFGNDDCGNDAFSMATGHTVQLARGIFMVAGVAARVACQSVSRMRHALTPPSTVARVQAAAEGEMNHHRDGCDDADDRSHGRCLSSQVLSAHTPKKLNRAA